jgi:hypothetical protein
MYRSSIRFIGLFLALLSTGGLALLSSRLVQICTPSGFDTSHFEVATWCQGLIDLDERPCTVASAERAGATSLSADACSHSLRFVVGCRTDREPAAQPPTIALSHFKFHTYFTHEECLVGSLGASERSNLRPRGRLTSPVGLPRPPPIT